MAQPISDEPKPGTGIDRTLIRKLLALTPSERARVAVESSRNWTALKQKIRRA